MHIFFFKCVVQCLEAVLAAVFCCLCVETAVEEFVGSVCLHLDAAGVSRMQL